MFKPIVVIIQEEVKCSAEKAFALAKDIERRPEWIDFIEKSYYTSKKEGIIGSKYKEKLEFLGFHLYLEYEIKEYVEGRLIIAKSNMAPFNPTISIYCKPIGNNRSIGGMKLELSPGPLALLPRKLVIREVEKFVEPLVERFKEMVEDGHVREDTHL